METIEPTCSLAIFALFTISSISESAAFIWLWRLCLSMTCNSAMAILCSCMGDCMAFPLLLFYTIRELGGVGLGVTLPEVR